MTTVHNFSVAAADGTTVDLAQYAGRVVLIVNTASKCGLTAQYEGLEQLYRELHPEGLEILAFPCNQFLAQEPGTDAQIQDFCRTSFGVTFPVLRKIAVNGDDADPLYKHLRAEQPGDFGPQYGEFYTAISSLISEAGADDVKWNFTKFLVDQNGRVVTRYEPPVSAADIAPDIRALLTARTTDPA